MYTSHIELHKLAKIIFKFIFFFDRKQQVKPLLHKFIKTKKKSSEETCTKA
jgi:hypothetical protein